MRISLLCAFVVAVALSFSPTAALSQEAATSKPSEPAQTAAVEAWLGKHAIPLSSVTAGAGFADLQPIKGVLKDVQLVGLGEATHGTREFFQFKHRMVEFLASEMGVQVFAIEASHAACQVINDYVVYGKGDRAKALASQGFWTWDTNEVSDMLDWMRAYNAKLPESKRIRFYGFDIQHNEHSAAVIAEYLRRVAPDHVAEVEAAFAPISNLKEQQLLSYSKRSDADKAQETSRLKELIAFLESHREEFVRRTSAAEFDDVLDDARVAAQFDDAYSRTLYDPKSPETSTSAVRDRYMAENIGRLLKSQGPDTRVVLWAHNGHIAAQPPAGMGGILRKTYGSAYYAFGFTTDHGTFQSRELTTNELGTGQGLGALKEFNLPAAPEGSVGWIFNAAANTYHLENYIVDFRAAPKEGPVADWLGSRQLMLSAGSMYSSKWPAAYSMAQVIPRDEFDGVIFIRQTSRARPNPTGMRGPAVEESDKKQ